MKLGIYKPQYKKKTVPIWGWLLLEVGSAPSLSVFKQTGQLQGRRSGGRNWKSKFTLTMFEVLSCPVTVETEATEAPCKEGVPMASQKGSLSSTFQKSRIRARRESWHLGQIKETLFNGWKFMAFVIQRRENRLKI